MIPQKIKSALIWIGVLIIIAATAYGATQLYTPKPPIQQTSNTAITPSIASPTLAQSETAVATRVCAKMEKVVAGLGMTPPLTLADCVEADRACVKLWGPHSVWAGAADENNVPYCDCDNGYNWATDGSGKCVVQQ